MPKNLHELLGNERAQQLNDAPFISGMRHPTWYPLFSEKRRRIDDLVHKAVNRISHTQE